MCVQRFLFVLISFLLGIAICVSALLRVDLPETTFHEANASLYVVLPVLHLVQVNPQVAAMLLIPLLYRGRCVVDRLAFGPAATPDPRQQSHLQVFLCALLI